MSKVVDFGKVQIFKSDPFDWSNDRTYEKLELVRYNGFTYLCIENTHVEGILPTNEDYFILIGFDASNTDALLAHVRNKNNPHNTQSVKTASECTGNSATATKATQDESGNNIKASYAVALEYNSTDRTLILKSKTGVILDTVSLDILDLLPVGTIIHVAYNVDEKGIPGYLPLNGGSFSRTTYAKLFEKLGTTYGSRNNSSFNVPDGNNRFLMISTTNIGKYEDAAIPNLYGHIAQRDDRTLRDSWVNATGIFYGEGVSSNRWRGTEGGYGAQYAAIDASRVSSVYKNGTTTVQPPAIRVRAFIKY